jgi:hypothetical protein
MKKLIEAIALIFLLCFQAAAAEKTEFTLPVKITQEPTAPPDLDAIARDKENLAIQSEMRDIAARSYYLALIQTLIAIAGTAGLIYTLRLTRSSTLAAIEAVDINREMMNKQLRAYVLLEQATIVAIPGTSPKFAVALTFRNGGQTPAINLRVDSILESHFAGDPFVLRPPQPGEGQFSILPGAKRDRLVGFFNPLQAAALQRGETELELHGAAYYKDIFGDTHISRFRLYGGGIHGFSVGDELAVSGTGNFEEEAPPPILSLQH